MACYGRLPSELRQRILQMALSDNGDMTGTWTRTLADLILVNQQMLEDIRSILSTYMPVHVIKRPSFSPSPPIGLSSSYYSLPRPTSICLSLFHTAQMEVLQDCSTWFFKLHHDLLNQWTLRTPQIFAGEIKTVLVDATPAPGYIRRAGPEWVATLVNDSRVKRFFMSRHIFPVINLIKCIPSSCGSKVDIVLSGIYSTRHRPWVDKVVRACSEAGIHVSVKAKFVDKPPPMFRPKPLTIVVQKLRPPRYDMEPKENMRWLTACRKMQTTYWRQSTQDLYKSCEILSKDQVFALLEYVLQFEAESDLQTFDLPPSEVLQRKFVHRVIEDMGLWTETLGEEPDRYVRLSRTPIAREWQSRTSDS